MFKFFAVAQNSDKGIVGSKLEHNFSQEDFLVLSSVSTSLEVRYEL